LCPQTLHTKYRHNNNTGLVKKISGRGEAEKLSTLRKYEFRGDGAQRNRKEPVYILEPSFACFKFHHFFFQKINMRTPTCGVTEL
jgi:hypothetical protein